VKKYLPPVFFVLYLHFALPPKQVDVDDVDAGLVHRKGRLIKCKACHRHVVELSNTVDMRL